jgi:NitT/TauT family transport system ATP-binding protein
MSAATGARAGSGGDARVGDAGTNVGAGTDAGRDADAARIEIDGVSLSFRDTSESLDVLTDVSLEVRRREVVALIGPNGCGKSTLLRVVAGLIAPDAGTVRLGGDLVLGPDPRVALVFQEPRLLAWRTAESNVRFPMELAGWSEARQAERAVDLLGLVGLRDFAAARPSQLSGGMRQRLAIARALALDPSVLLLDEPFSALDALTRERFNIELLRLWERTGTTIVLVTHSITEAAFVADRVVVLSPRPARVVADIPVGLARPRSLAQLDSPAVGRLAARIRSHLVDTTDDAVALREAAAFVQPGAHPKDRARESAADAGTAAWFDPFGSEEER